eukprot:2968071-Rhodomonas_salina.1
MAIWMMPTDQVSQNLPAAFGCFDVVILDEASQSNMLAFPALVRGKKVIVVGDDEQVAPRGDPKWHAELQSVLSQANFGTQTDLNLSPGRSVFDLFKANSAAERVTLREHYRCLPQIIGFSKEMFYKTMIPLRRDYTRASPVELVFVRDGKRDSSRQTNMNEAHAIVSMVCIVRPCWTVKAFECLNLTCQCLSDWQVRKILNGRADCPSRSKEGIPLSIGIISLWGEKQAKAIERLIDQDPVLCAKKTEHEILCGDATKFQGAERDIILLSMVADSRSREVKEDSTSPNDLGPHVNVAASRGKEKLYIFHSFDRHSSKFSEEDWRRKLLTHYYNNQSWWQTVPRASPFASVLSDLPKVRVSTIIAKSPITVEIAEVFCHSRGPLAFVLHKKQSKKLAAETWKQELICSFILTRMGWNVSWLWETDSTLWPRQTAQELQALIKSIQPQPEAEMLLEIKAAREEQAVSE